MPKLIDAAVVAVFGKTARPIMRRWMNAASCIGATRTTIEVMRLYGLRAVEHPVCYAFQVPARKYARVGGFSTEEQAEMRAKATGWKDVLPDGPGWNGHLVALVEDRWLIDPALDQTDAPEFGVSVPTEAFVVDTAGYDWDPHKNFEIRLGLVLDNGDHAELMYRSIGDRSYRESEAWNDEGLPLLAVAIAAEMERRGGEKVPAREIEVKL
jgi:hypothetical protein